MTPATASPPAEELGFERSGAATPATDFDRSGQFALNLAANLGRLGLSMVVGLWYVPFLLRHLGAAAYGLVPLTSAITSYMALIILGLDSAMSRYLTIALGREEHHEANVIFNTAFWASVSLSVLLLLPAAVAVAEVEHLVRIPPGYLVPTRWLFAATLAAFLLNQIKIPFGVSTFSRNRLDLDNLVTISETLTRVGVVVGLFYLVAPRLEYVGAAILVGMMVSTGGTIWLWKKLTPSLSIRLDRFQWTKLRELWRTGGWVLVSQLGVMLFVNIDLIVANRLFGAESAGRYAAVLQLPVLMRMISFAIGGIFPPTTFHLYGRKDIEGLVAFLNRSIKFLGLMLALPLGLLCGFSEPLLRLWLGPSFGSLAPLLFLMSVHLCLNLAVYPLYTVPVAVNRVRVPGLVTLAVGIGNLGLALLLAGVFGWGLYGLAAAGAATLTFRHLVFSPLYCAHILQRSPGTFYREMVPIAVAALAVIGLCRALLWRWSLTHWMELALAGLGVSLLFVGVVYLWLSPAERSALRDAVVQARKQVQGGR